MAVSEAAPAAARRARLGRSTAVFALWTAVSRVAGLAREIAVAVLFGTAGAINAFTIAFQIPNVIRSLVADSALSAAFIPVLTELEEKGRHREAQLLAGALASLIVIGLSAVTLVLVALAPFLIPLIVPEPLADDTVVFTQLMMPIVVLLGLTGLVAAILQAGGRFGATAFAPVLWNLIIIGVVVGFAPFYSGDDRVVVYAIAIVVGTLAQLVFLVPFVAELRLLRPHLDIPWENVRRVLRLMLPVTLGLGLININMFVDVAAFAGRVEEGAPRAIEAAFRLYLLPQGVFSVAVATVLFPEISRLAAREDLAGLREAVASGLRQIFLLLVPATAILLLLAEPVVRVVFEYGRFDAASTDLTAEALIFFSLGLVFNGASLLVIRAFFGLKRPWLPTAVAGLGVVLNVVFDALLYRPLGVGGITLATSIVSAVTFLLLVVLLRRELGGLRGRWVLDGTIRVCAAGVACGAVGWAAFAGAIAAAGDSRPAEGLALAVAIGLAATAYYLACRALRVPEITAIGRYLRPLR